MATDLNYETENSDSCQIKICDRLGEYPTVRSLINALKDKLSVEIEERLNWTSTQTLDNNIKILEEEYTKIPGIIDTYQKSYDDLKTKLKGYEDFYKKIESMTNDPGEPQEGIRQAIRKLKMTGYDAKDKKLYEEYKNAWNSLHSIQCKTCVEQAKDKVSTQPEETTPAKSTPAKKEESLDPIAEGIADKKVKGAKEKFSYYKDFQKKVQIWFSDLDNLQKKINQLEDKNFRQRYAYRLEFSDVLERARILNSPDIKKRPAANAEWLKHQLIENFKSWVYEVYQYFYWQKECLTKEDYLTKSWEKYERFLKTRQQQFLNESDEIPAEVSEQNEECS